jgi:hypothetical protein
MHIVRREASMIWFRRKTPGLRSPHPELRDELLADAPLAAVADRGDDDPDTPNARFHAARAAVIVGDKAQARRHLRELLSLPAIATQVRLQAWTCLRELDEPPPADEGGAVRGVVIDFGTADGLDTLAAYEDHSAFLIHHGGGTATAEAPDDYLETCIDQLLAVARGVVGHTDPHRGHREHPPEAGHVCIRVLTWAGTHVGLGPLAVLQRDPVGGPVLLAADTLRELLAARAAQKIA